MNKPFKMQRNKKNPSLDNDDMSVRLKVFTFGRFSIVIDGKPLIFKGKAQHQPLKLLKVLIVLGGRDINKCRISDILYPDGEGDKSLRALTTTLHRLRKLLGNNDIIHFNDCKLTLDAKYCWVDVWSLERLLGTIDKDLMHSTVNNDYIFSLTNRILQLYKGEFLGELIDDSWVLPYREHIRNRFLRKIRLLGLYWEKRKQYEMAVDIYLRALEEDELSEEFYQRLMICYQKLGLRSEAISVYERCSRNLKSFRGIKPSVKTKTLVKSIISLTE